MVKHKKARNSGKSYNEFRSMENDRSKAQTLLLGGRMVEKKEKEDGELKKKKRKRTHSTSKLGWILCG